MTSYIFIGEIELSPNDIKKIEIEILAESELQIVYDDVYDKLIDKMIMEFPETYYPMAKLNHIFLKNNNENGETEFFPVVSNENDIEMYKEKGYKKILKLCAYTYTLTKECFLFETLKKYNIIPIDAEFDFETMHSVLNDYTEFLKTS